MTSTPNPEPQTAAMPPATLPTTLDAAAHRSAAPIVRATETSGERWEWQQLANACTARFGQDSVLWTIIGSFWSTTAVLLVALGASGSWSSELSLRAAICGTGVAVAFLWLIMQAAALRRVIFYEDLIKNLESELKLPDAARLHPGNDPEGHSVETETVAPLRKDDHALGARTRACLMDYGSLLVSAMSRAGRLTRPCSRPASSAADGQR